MFIVSFFQGSNELDFNEIAEKCGVDTKPPEEVIRNLSELDQMYNSTELVQIYNFLLNNVKNNVILEEIVKLSDSHRDKSTLDILQNILLQKIRLSVDEDLVSLRAMCAKVIANYKETSTLTALLHCLNDKHENYKIRLACADALGRIGDPFAVAPLINVVKDEDEKSIYVKESATFALGLLGDTSAVDPLVAIMEAKQGLWDKFSFLKEKIVEALGKLNINSYKVLKVYKTSLMDSSPMVRINAIEALMNSDFEESEDLIRTALHDEDEEVQRNALIALYNMIGGDILEEIISLPSYSEFLKEEAKNLQEEYEEEENE